MRSLLLGLLLVAVPLSAQEVAPDYAKRVRDFVAAFNRHDVDAMIAATEPDVRWMQVEGERASIEVAGHAALRSWLESYFARLPSARSEVGAIAVSGTFASTVETSSWTRANGSRAEQAAPSVYEFAPDGRLRHVWYFSVQTAKAAQ